MSPVTVIAEAGVNHNGRLDLALQLVDAAKAAGADVVKFQTFVADELVTPQAERAAYQQRNAGGSDSQLAMLRELELGFADHHRLVEHCREVGIGFLSTAFDFTSLAFLVDEIGLTTLKIPSGELTNAPFVLAHARAAERLIVSSGMATLGEVERALGVIAFGMTAPGDVEPSRQAFESAYGSEAGRRALRERVTVLHCTSEYPAPPAEVNLAAMPAMGAALGLGFGYSDHTAGIAVPIAAVALGASVVEKHFTLDRSLPGPDHRASLEPAGLAAMVDGIREVAVALGDPVKRPQPSELPNRDLARKSLVATGPIVAGERFTPQTLGVMRPGTGLSPYAYWTLLGSVASRDYAPGELVEETLP